jgi:hypothetical protein
LSAVATTSDSTRTVITVRTVWLVAAGIVFASAYGLLADEPYRGVSDPTVIAARAQDVCSVVVAALLLVLARAANGHQHVVRLGLLAYVAYSYAVYLVGIPMNRMFLVYVVIESLSVALLLDGLVRLRPAGWPRTQHRPLERGTGWMLLVIAGLFTALWLTALVPYAFGGHRPDPEGPGGVAYPIFVLDLVVVLPCLAAIGLLLLKGHRVAGPLAVVALVKIITLFTALWAGVLVGFVEGADVRLGADAGPSVLMLLVCVVVLRRWWSALTPDPDGYAWPRLWSPED